MSETGKVKTVCGLLFLLAALQAVRFGIISLLSFWIHPTVFSHTCMSAFAFAVIGCGFLLFAHVRKFDLYLLPKWKSNKEKICYIAVSFFAAVLLVTTPVFSGGYQAKTIINLAYSSLVIPFCEEIIFRGFVWNRLSRCFKSEWAVYAIVTVLFAVWHFGYADSILFQTAANGRSVNLPVVLFYKAKIGFAFGVITGFCRLKTKNCYTGFLVHGVLNLFAR